ncbi:MAG TPA: hypothetical protein VK400_18440 [Pyrinomonadaceae bacterium]|nr:hypothetical protein [Pyrinomonadaceae bacterium]
MLLPVIARISLILFLVAVPFLFYGFGREMLRVIPQISLGNARWLAFIAGAVVFVPSLFIAKRLFPATWSYLQTLEHELTHLLVGLVFLKIPVGIRVSAHEGGEVRQIGLGTTGHTWVTLAPYFLPTVSLAVLIFAYFAGLNSRLVLGILGWTTAFHLVTNWSETSFRQPDLQKAGLLKTLLILPVMNLICYGSVLAYVGGGAKGFGGFWSEGARASLGLLKYMIFR